MKVLIGIFLGLILAFLTSKFKINIRYLNKEKHSFSVKFNVNLGIYLFGFIKILGISLKEDGMHFLCFRFPYNKMKIDADSMKILKEFSVWNFLKSLKIKLEKFNLNLKIGTEDMMLTVFLVFALSTFLSILSAKARKQINLKNYYYKITPIYEVNQLSFLFSSQISIKIWNILKSLKSLNETANEKKEYKVHVKKVPLKI